MFGATEKARMTTPAGTLRVMLSLVGQNIYVEEVPEGTAGVPATRIAASNISGFRWTTSRPRSPTSSPRAAC